MRKRFLIAGTSLAATLFIAGCATQPYATRYSDGTMFRGGGEKLKESCKPAIVSPWDSGAVLTCLEARAGQWESRGVGLRTQTNLVGGLTIPASAAGIGLAARGVTGPSLPVLGLLTGTAVTYNSIYASPEAAGVYETATNGYSCLVNAVSQWNGTNAGLGRAWSGLSTAYAAFETNTRTRLTSQPQEAQSTQEHASTVQADSRVTLARAGSKEADTAKAVSNAISTILVEEQTVARQLDHIVQDLDVNRSKAERDYDNARQADGPAGARLLAKADDIDNTAIQSLGKLQPRPSDVSAAAPGLINSIANPISSSQTAPAAKAGAAPPGGESLATLEGPPNVNVADLCRQMRDPGASPPTDAAGPNVRKLCQVFDAETQRLADLNVKLNLMNDELASVNRSLSVLQQAIVDYKPTDPNLGASCTTQPFSPTPLVGPTGQLVLDATQKTSIFIAGGRLPYAPVSLPAGLSLAPSLKDGGEQFDLTATDNAGAAGTGPWTITFHDAASTPAQLTVTVVRPK